MEIYRRMFLSLWPVCFYALLTGKVWIKPMTMNNTLSGENGFSIIELIVVVAIAALLMAIASFSMDFVRKERVTSYTKQIFADIQKARFDAVTSGPTPTGIAPYKRGDGIRFVSATQYVSYVFNDSLPVASALTDTGDYQYTNQTEEVGAETVNISSCQIQIQTVTLHTPANNFQNDMVIFDRFGYPRQWDWQVLSPMYLVISNPSLAGYVRCISISSTIIREGFWNGATCQTF